MVEYDRIRAVKKTAKARLMAIPGVHAVGVGPKITAGKHTGEHGIVVFLEKKRPLSELSANEVVPAEIDGVKTDVQEAGRPRLLSEDTSSYRPLRGGIQIEPGGGFGGHGTLGCIARSDALDAVFALTCEHVVGIAAGATPDLAGALGPGGSTLILSGANTMGAIVVVTIGVTAPGANLAVNFDIIQRAAPGMTPTDVAKGVQDKANALTNPGFTATATGAQVTFADAGKKITSFSYLIDGLHYLPDSGIKPKIAENVITLSGEANSSGAAYVAINLGGAQPSYSAFAAITKQDSYLKVGQEIAAAINQRNLTGVVATPSNSTVTVTQNGVAVEELECDISTDRQVGQPTNCFCSNCCSCNDRIGTVYDARLDLDVALIKLDPGLKYRAEIYVGGTKEKDWVVKGSHAITDADVQTGSYKLKKRGRTTLDTYGTIAATSVDGVVIAVHDSGDVGFPTLFHRHYTECIAITGNTGTFCAGGDSGSSILSDPGNEVIGILFAGGGSTGVATPIQPILDAYSLIVQIADDWGLDQTVPGTATQSLASEAAQSGAMAKEIQPPFSAAIGRHLETVQSQIAATTAGREYADVVRRHADEARRLVNTNRRVATVWKRSNGPQIVQAVLSATSSPDGHIPSEIQGRPVDDCLRKIYETFLRYSSSEFAADLKTLGPRLFELLSLSYAQALATLVSWEPTRVSENSDGR